VQAPQFIAAIFKRITAAAKTPAVSPDCDGSAAPAITADAIHPGAPLSTEPPAAPAPPFLTAIAEVRSISVRARATFDQSLQSASADDASGRPDQGRRERGVLRTRATEDADMRSPRQLRPRRLGAARGIVPASPRVLIASAAALIALALPAAASAQPPAVTIDPTVTSTITTAQVSGTVNAHGEETRWTFEVSTDGVSWSPTNLSSYIESTGPEPVSGTIEGLTAATQYAVRLGAQDREQGTYYYSSLTPSFTTAPAPVAPSLTLPAPVAAYNSAGPLQGTVDPEGGNFNAPGQPVPIHWAIEVSTSGDPGSWSEVSSGDIAGDPAGESTPIAVPEAPVQASSLVPATTYHYRLRAVYAGQVVETDPTRTFETLPVAKPGVENVAISSVTAQSAHFSGKVNPNGTDPAFETSWHFECVAPGPSCGAPSGSPVPPGTSSVEVTADAELQPNKAYYVHLVASNAGGSAEAATVPQPSLTTPAIAPDLTLSTSTEATPTSIVLNGTVNPHNSPLSDCHFAYGLGTALDHNVPCEGTLPTDEGVAGVTAELTGLAPGVEYSIQLLAANPAGSAESAPAHFGTPTGASPASCPNEVIRLAQQAIQTGDCRAWEQVTPGVKGGADIAAGGLSTGLAADDGNAAVFESLSGFADSQGSGVNGRITYLARRGSDGWMSHPLTPLANPKANLVAFTGTIFMAGSEDLSHGLIRAYELPGVANDTPERDNFYVQDTADRSLQAVTGSQTGEGDPIQYPFPEFTDEYKLWGSSADLSHTSFVVQGQMVPAVEGEYPNGQRNAYTWDQGTVHLAGILPDGTVPAGGSEIGPETYKGSMSSDGSRLAFSSPASGPGQLYLRIDHAQTDLISESENSAFTGEPQSVQFEGMTPDGDSVFFQTESPLLAADTAPGQDLYRWTYGPDPAHEDNLTLITNTGHGIPSGSQQQSGATLVGMSDDGTRVYFTESTGQLRVWEEGVTKTVSSSVSSTGWKTSLALTAANPGYSRVSPNGNWLAYLDSSRLYLYNLSKETLTCASCPGTLLTPYAFTGTDLTANTSGTYPDSRPRYLTSDGKVFFTTESALLPRDTNGVADVYSYDGATGRLNLVSSGTGDGPSEFVDASKSGDDVFFVTRQELVPSDTDPYVDFYDARAGGGFDEPNGAAVEPCSGEICQGDLASSPPAAAVASGATGPGNPSSAPRCPKNRRKVRRHGKIHCVKRGSSHPEHQKRHAGATKGVGK
jgi:hypothetical protein